MSRASLLHRWIRWTTLLAVVMAALAPAVSHALAAARGDVMPWSQVCSVDGGMQTSLGPQSSPGEPGAQHVFEHCPYCALHHDGFAPPPAPIGASLTDGAAQALPALFLHAPRPLFAWSAALPRAPPVHFS